MKTSLDAPDDSAWHVLSQYSHDVAARLRRAYAYLAAGPRDPKNYRRAVNELARCELQIMADPQRIRLCYVRALGASAEGDRLNALDWTDTALELAVEVDDTSAATLLLYLRGATNAAMLRMAEACDDYSDSRALLNALVEEGRPIDRLLQYDLITNEIPPRFFRAEYDQAEQLLDEARGVLPYLHHARLPLEAARIPWMEAHLYRWRGEPERALRPALAAAQVFAEADAAASTVRIESFTADVILDLAAALPASSDRDALFLMAAPHVLHAIEVADRVADEAGSILARLTHLRLSRMRGENRARVHAIEHLARQARRLGDEALLTLAFTTLGDEHSSRGEVEAAANLYRQALAVLDGSDVPATGVWARRALVRLSHEAQGE